MRRTFALLLAAVMAAGTLTGPAMAAESQQEGTADSASQEVQEETKLPPDPEGTVTWANLDSRIRSGSLSARVLSENISGIEGIDYDLMYEDLRRQLNDIANAQWYITMVGGDDSSLANAYDSLRDTFDDLKDGEVQADNADVVWQLNSTVDQMVAAGETLYITLVGLEQQAADGQRSLAALDRSLEELRLRQQLRLCVCLRLCRRRPGRMQRQEPLWCGASGPGAYPGNGAIRNGVRPRRTPFLRYLCRQHHAAHVEGDLHIAEVMAGAVGHRWQALSCSCDAPSFFNVLLSYG